MIKKKVGLIGCGAIGTVLAEAIERKLVVCDELVVYDVDASKAQKLKASFKFPVTIVETSMNYLLKAQGNCGSSVTTSGKRLRYKNCSSKHRANRHEHRRIIRFRTI